MRPRWCRPSQLSSDTAVLDAVCGTGGTPPGWFTGLSTNRRGSFILQNIAPCSQPAPPSSWLKFLELRRDATLGRGRRAALDPCARRLCGRRWLACLLVSSPPFSIFFKVKSLTPELCRCRLANYRQELKSPCALHLAGTFHRATLGCRNPGYYFPSTLGYRLVGWGWAFFRR